MVNQNPRPVAASVAELLAGATRREPMGKHVDSLSGSPFERAVIDGEPYVVKTGRNSDATPGPGQ